MPHSVGRLVVSNTVSISLHAIPSLRSKFPAEVRRNTCIYILAVLAKTYRGRISFRKNNLILSEIALTEQNLAKSLKV